MIQEIDKILAFLASDGELHKIGEISRTLNIPLDICENIANFLAKYNFIQITDRYLKINPRMRDLYTSDEEKTTIQVVPTQ